MQNNREKEDPIGSVPWPMFGPLIVQRALNRKRARQMEQWHIVRELARQQIIASRAYVQELIDQTPQELWQHIPPGMPSHIAWQLGHLAMAQYRLTIVFTRPVTAEDQAVMPDTFLNAFRKGTQAADTAGFSAADILDRFHRVHEHVLATWPMLEQLDPYGPPQVENHRIVRTRLDALFWASRHEMIHAGQIGLIRRGLGLASIW